MKRNTKIILGLGVASLVIVALSLTAFSQKPPKLTTVWGAQIPDYVRFGGEAPNIVGMNGGEYIYNPSTDANVRATVYEGSAREPLTGLRFFIYENALSIEGEPGQTSAMFRNVAMPPVLTWAEDPGPLGYCGFPASEDNAPDCLFHFLNSSHPKQGYEYLVFGLQVGENLEAFPIGQEILFTGDLGVWIDIWNWTHCGNLRPIPALNYPTVLMNMARRDFDGGRGFFVTRTSANTWEFRVEEQPFGFRTAYCFDEIETIAKGKKTYDTSVRHNYEPLTGEIRLSYKIVLIKNP